MTTSTVTITHDQLISLNPPKFLQSFLPKQDELVSTTVANLRVELSRIVRQNHLGSDAAQLADGYDYVARVEDFGNIIGNGWTPAMSSAEA